MIRNVLRHPWTKQRWVSHNFAVRPAWSWRWPGSGSRKLPWPTRDPRAICKCKREFVARRPRFRPESWGVSMEINSGNPSNTKGIYKSTVKSRWIDTLWQGWRKFWLSAGRKSCRGPLCGVLCGGWIFSRHRGSPIGSHTQCVLHAERFSGGRAKVCQIHRDNKVLKSSEICKPFPMFFRIFRRTKCQCFLTASPSSNFLKNDSDCFEKNSTVKCSLSKEKVCLLIESISLIGTWWRIYTDNVELFIQGW